MSEPRPILAVPKEIKTNTGSTNHTTSNIGNKSLDLLYILSHPSPKSTIKQTAIGIKNNIE